MSADQTRGAPPVPDPVQWSEGLLLQPQHFQQAWLRQDGLLHYHLSRVAPFHFGVSRVEIDGGMLAAGRFRVVALQAVMPDGLLVWSDGAGPDLALDLTPYKEDLRKPERVHLLVPVQHPGSARPKDDLARWRSHDGPEAVDENTGTDPEPIARLRPNLRLLLGGDVPARFTALPLAEVAFADQKFRLTDYEPPRFALTADNPIGKDCRTLVEALRAKAKDVVHSQTGDGQRSEARHAVLCLTAGLPTLEALLRLPTVHPFDLSMALQRVVGLMVTLRPDMEVPLTEAYDHLDPRGTIKKLIQTVLDGLEKVTQAFSTLAFDDIGGVFRATIQEGWADGGLIVGLRLKPNQLEGDAVAWMEGALIAPGNLREELEARRMRGAGRSRLRENDPDGFRTPQDIVLFRVAAGDGYVVTGTALEIVNPVDREGVRRPHEILIYIRQSAGGP